MPTDLNLSTNWGYALVIYANTISDITSQILWIRYAHVLLRLKALNIFFYAAKMIKHFKVTKYLMINQVTEYLLQLTITLKFRSSLNRPYFAYLKVILSIN